MTHSFKNPAIRTFICALAAMLTGSLFLAAAIIPGKALAATSPAVSVSAKAC